jgi:hypothetical protein
VVEQNRFGTVIPEPDPSQGPPQGPPSAFPAPPQYGAPPAATYPPPPGYPAGYPAGYAAPGFGPPPQAGRSTGAKVAIGIAIAAGSLVVLGILAAIAIPVFLNQHAKAIAARTSVTLPDSVAGYAKLPAAAQQSVQSLVAQMPAEGHAQGAVYGHGVTPDVVVIVGSHVLTASDQRDYLAAVNDSERKASGLEEASVPAGPLGGTLQCGSSPDGRRTDCAFVDAGAFGVIDVVGTGATAQQLALAVRSEVEHRS